MKRFPIFLLIISALLILYRSAESTTIAATPPCADTHLSAIPLQTTFKLGYSALFYTPKANSSRPLSITGSIRLFEAIEPSASLLIGIPSSQPDAPALKNRLLSGAFEVRMSPTFGTWYRPSIGIGWFYTEWWPNLTRNGNQGTFCSLSLIGVAPRQLTLPIRRNNNRSFIQPSVSIGDIRFGPVIPWGKRWSENSGNYYFEVTLFNIGMTLW